MQPALFDTSVYISALRRGNDAALASGGWLPMHHYG